MKNLVKIIVLLFVVFFSFRAEATNYFVNDGSTSGDKFCSSIGAVGNLGTTKATPNTKLSYIFSNYVLTVNDTVFIDAGTYNDLKTIVGANDHDFVIYGASNCGTISTIYDGLSNPDGGWLELKKSTNSNIKICNIYIKNHIRKSTASNEGGALRCWGESITGLSLNNCVFENCDAPSSSGGGAIYYRNYWGDATLNLTDVKVFSSDNPLTGAVSVDASYRIDMTISRCSFYSNTSGTSGSAFSITGWTGSNVNISNSLFYKNEVKIGGHNGALWIDQTGGRVTLTMNSTTIAYNKSFLGNYAGLVIGNGGTITNSIIYGNDKYDVYKAGGSLTLTNTYYKFKSGTMSTPSCSTSDPLFKNTVTDDYSLSSSSTCINTGMVIGAPTNDILQATRDALPDIGCYEYGVTSSFSTPTISGITSVCVGATT
ncbi:MAG: hypothetical protein KA264_04795, partial [Crocinitomicaceae bacterium]|nr:hypothetical protein [Crocinitomicaceae bacterium]